MQDVDPRVLVSGSEVQAGEVGKIKLSHYFQVQKISINQTAPEKTLRE